MKTQEARKMSYRIVNNVIYLGAGETATYDVRVIDRSTGAPYILPVDKGETIGNAIISFVVRPSVYSKSSDPVIKKYIWLCATDNENIVIPDDIECNDYLRLDTTVIYDYVESDWSNGYGFNGGTQPQIKALYKKLLSDGSGYEYRFFDASAEDDGTDYYMWKTYDFRITFPFYYEDTIGLAPKQYKYDVALFAGPNLTISDDGDGKKSLKNFNYKEILLSPTDFIVEGTLSE